MIKLTEEEFKKNAKTIPIDIEKEEKAAIDYFKYKVLPTTNGAAFESKEEHYTKMVLNVIEKLQKENEELKEDNLGIREENIKLVNCHISYERYTGLDFLLPDKFKYAIPKDKIREKIKELEEYIVKEEEETCGKCITIGEDMTIRYLKELLEEE